MIGARDTLRKHKIKATPQRLCVYAALRAVDTHASVDTIYRTVKKKLPSISLATVYTAVEHLKSKGLLREIKIDFERSLYEARIDEHHHFLCKKCGQIFDIEMDPCPALKRKKVDDHAIDDFQGYFYGMCKHCR